MNIPLEKLCGTHTKSKVLSGAWAKADECAPSY